MLMHYFKSLKLLILNMYYNKKIKQLNYNEK